MARPPDLFIALALCAGVATPAIASAQPPASAAQGPQPSTTGGQAPDPGLSAADPSGSNISSPATTPGGGAASSGGGDPDPWEKLNRKSYTVFVYLDRNAIRPAAVFYGHAVPHPLRRGLHNAIQNVNSPVIFLNDVLQLQGDKAMQTLGRFAINSIFGVAGLADVAAKAGVPYHDNGFGTTLGHYGVGPGPFLFIPVIGPSDVRDALGSGVDALSDPLTWINYTGRWEVGAAKTVVGGLDTRYNADPQLKTIDATATDPYATLRSLYLQNRAAQVNGGQVDVKDLPDFGPAPAGPAADSEPQVPPPPAAATAAQPPTPSP